MQAYDLILFLMCFDYNVYFNMSFTIYVYVYVYIYVYVYD